MPRYPRNPLFKRYFKGDPLNHPPIPESFDKTTSIELTPRLDTGTKPGPGTEGPLDPRLYYPRTIQNARPPGQGCSTCRWQGICKVYYYQRNFGFMDRDEARKDQRVSKSIISPKYGTACESWNVDFPPLPPSAYDTDGLGVGDPFSSGKVPDSVFDPFSYDGQYGDLRADVAGKWDSRNV